MRIDLSSNKLTGILRRSLGSLSLLKILQLNRNQLEGIIPDSVGDQSSLELLTLSYNNLNGSLPKSVGKLGKLSFLELHHNLLTGIVMENHFANLTALEALWVGDNKLAFNLVNNSWNPPFNLKVL
ncbi:unnamed protein product [Lactuca saligna]|uniref:Uncharacterized protein n=1 Tax=Lactuca saligna TaxID=75948 RepID=A0AA35ZVN1_LACSI|nr:unnamed protein product [Lactuca saligna]